MSKVDLTNVFDNLKLDKINVDVTLAEQYLEKKQSEFHYLNFEPKSPTVYFDNYGNKIHGVDLTETLLPTPSPPSSPWAIIQQKLKQLAIELEENLDLFCQLEFLIRQIQIQDTKTSLNLIIKNLLNASSDMKAAYIQEEIIVVQDNTPMLVLGFVAQIFKMCDDPIILCTIQTAVICHLFTELCLKIGWEIPLVVVKSTENLKPLDTDYKDAKVYPNLFNGLLPEVTGVVTEQSDLDSAIDIFLNSGSHPMPLTRILVQESVYEEFKEIIAWKSKLNHAEDKNDDSFLSDLCTDVFDYAKKKFIFNFAGNSDVAKSDITQIIVVEAYRTVKELLSFIKTSKRLCLSLWVSGLSEANEIALNTDVPIIWVNDYCNFDGPDEVSKTIYKRIDSLNITLSRTDSIDQMIKRQDVWLKKSFASRCYTILKVLKDINIGLGEQMELQLCDWKINNFIDKDNKTMTLGFNMPDKAVVYHTVGTVAVPSPSFDNIIRALINGSAVIIVSEPRNEEEIFIGFEKAGVPIAFQSSDHDTNEPRVSYPLGDSWCYHTKVIWTNFGTIFAN